MIVAPFHPDDILRMEVQREQKPWLEFGEAPMIARMLAAHTSTTISAENGEIIGCMGIAPLADRTPMAWAAFSPLVKRHARSLLRFLRATLDAWPAPRIVAEIYPDHANAAPFARALGFRFEKWLETHPSGMSGVALYGRIKT